MEAEAFFGVDFPWGEGNGGGGYLLIAGDFAFLRSLVILLLLAFFCSIVLEFYYRDTTH